MSETANLQMPIMVSGQAQKTVTHNEALLRLDALVQLVVVSATAVAQPGAPSDGQIFILPAGKTGAAWGPMANQALAYYHDGAWEEIAPREGWSAFVKDTDIVLTYSGAAWTADIKTNGAILHGANGVPSFRNTLVPTLVNAGPGASHNLNATIRHTTPGGGGAQMILAATRGLSEVDYTALQNGDGLGSICFCGADGDQFVDGAYIRASVDGAPGNDDMPTRLTFWTTPDGSPSSAERLRIDNAGHVTPGADNAQAFGANSARWSQVHATQFRPGAGAPIWTSGSGTPEGAVTAPVGSLYTRTDGGAGTTLYIKETGAGATGWVGK